MKNLIALAAMAAIVSGCQTRIMAEKRPEIVVPLQEVVSVNGQEQVVTTGAIRASGGWQASARSPLWAREELRGLAISVETNGVVKLSLDSYERDLSTNAVEMAHNLVSDFAVLAEKAAAAYATCGASVAADSFGSAARKAIARYVANGGSSERACVSCSDGECTITDGSVTETVSY